MALLFFLCRGALNEFCLPHGCRQRAIALESTTAAAAVAQQVDDAFAGLTFGLESDDAEAKAEFVELFEQRGTEPEVAARRRQVERCSAHNPKPPGKARLAQEPTS